MFAGSRLWAGHTDNQVTVGRGRHRAVPNAMQNDVLLKGRSVLTMELFRTQGSLAVVLVPAKSKPHQV